MTNPEFLVYAAIVIIAYVVFMVFLANKPDRPGEVSSTGAEGEGGVSWTSITDRIKGAACEPGFQAFVVGFSLVGVLGGIIDPVAWDDNGPILATLGGLGGWAALRLYLQLR